MAKMQPDTNIPTTNSSNRNDNNSGVTGVAAASLSQTGPTSAKVILNPQDVLLGRGDWTVRYEGNVRFRDLIREKRDLFGAASGRSARDLVASDIIRIINERGGRFLRKETDTSAAGAEDDEEEKGEALKQRSRSSSGVVEGPAQTDHQEPETSPMDGNWVVVDKKTAMKKVKQAFRDKDSWTQKVDVGHDTAAAVAGRRSSGQQHPHPPSTVTGFASMRIPTQRHPSDSEVVSLLKASSQAVLPSPAALLANASLPPSQSDASGRTPPPPSVLSHAAMAENLHRLEFERTLMAAVQQQQMQRQMEVRRLAELTRLRQLSSSMGWMNPGNNSTTGTMSQQQQQQLLASLQQQHSNMDASTSSGIGGNTNRPTTLQLQQHLLLMQQQQQQQLEVAMLLRARQQEEAAIGAASMAQQQQQALAIHQLRMKQLQQQQQHLPPIVTVASSNPPNIQNNNQNASLQQQQQQRQLLSSTVTDSISRYPSASRPEPSRTEGVNGESVKRSKAKNPKRKPSVEGDDDIDGNNNNSKITLSDQGHHESMKENEGDDDDDEPMETSRNSEGSKRKKRK